MQDEEFFVTCKCSSLDHIVRVTYDPDDTELYLTVHLAPHRFWKRVTNAFRYVFGSRSRYGDHEEVLVSVDDARKIATIVNCFVSDSEVKGSL